MLARHDEKEKVMIMVGWIPDQVRDDISKLSMRFNAQYTIQSSVRAFTVQHHAHRLEQNRDVVPQ